MLFRSYVKSISKKPEKITTELDGNILLHYKVDLPEKITTIYLVRVYGNKTKSINNFQYTDTKAIKNWDYTRGYPKYILSTIKNSNKYDTVGELFDITKNTLIYNNEKTNYDYINRIGAENLNDKNFSQAVCLEYSDLLISLLRGLKIPAKEINGYAINTNDPEKPLPHSWVEYLTKDNFWTQVDPTWADTSNQNYLDNFDLYHIEFLVKGANSEFPKLPGSYKVGVLEEAVELKVLSDSPDQNQIIIKKINVASFNIIKNDSYNTLFFNNKIVKPGGWAIFYKSNLKVENTLFILKWEPFTYKDFLNRNLAYLFPLLLSPIFFYVTHKKLKKISKKREKIKSII